jgi:hypothetical protein
MRNNVTTQGSIVEEDLWRIMARELLTYLDTELAVEESLAFAVGFLVETMRAAVFAKAARTLAPAHGCWIYRNCRLS